MAAEGAVRLGTARRNEAGSGVCLLGRPGYADSGLDARPGLSFGEAGEPSKMPPVRLPTRCRSFCRTGLANCTGGRITHSRTTKANVERLAWPV